MLKTLRDLRGGAIAALFAASLGAQTPSWNLPASGYVYDSVAGTIRPVLGFPGSSYAGPAVLKGVAWASVAPDGRAAWASVAPDGRAALIVQQDRLWWTQDLSNANIPPVGIDAIDSVADCRWSADASAAAVLSSRTATVTWLSGPRVTNSLRLPALPVTNRRQLPA